MARLGHADLRAVLDFLGDAPELVDGRDPVFPPPLLALLGRLVPCDFVTYSELDRTRRKLLPGSGWDPSLPVPSDLEERFWGRVSRVHPLYLHQGRTHDFTAARLSDFLTVRQLHRLEVHADWFGWWGVDRMVMVGIPSPLSHTKNFLFHRGRGSDFSERDRGVLNVLQPHLGRLYELAQLRRRLRAGPAAGAELPLTPREREILECVREGRTNAEIARALWISPLTVRRHLENVYAKLGVRTRTAAVAVLSGNAAPPPRS